MKKILSLMALLLLTVTTAWADTATVSYNNSEVSDPEGFFTHDANGKFNFHSKFTGAEYDGINFTYGLKMEGSTKILFTTTEESTVTIVQSTVSSNTIKFDGNALSVDDAAEGTGCRIYTIENVAAGDHNITRGSGESGIFYVKAEWTDAKTVYFDNTATQWGQVNIWAWNDTENFTGGSWPGVEMETTETANLYKWTTTGNPTKVIFSNNGASQTSQDGWNFVDGVTYNVNGQVRTVTFTTDAGWTEAWAYVYSGQGEEAPNEALGIWPGTQMTSTGEGTWTISFGSVTVPEKIIFHNNAGTEIGSQDFEDGKAYEYNQNHYTATFTTDKAWEEVYAYAWTGDDEGATKYLGNWPGTKLEATAGVYTVAIDTYGDAPEKILFNNGKGESDPQKEQTPDWTFVNEKAYDYSQHTYTATFTTDAGWEHVYAYVWTTKDDKTTVYSEAWPGTVLTADEGVYTVTINTYDDAPQKIQFNGGTDETKAGDWNFVDGKAYKYFTATPIYALTTGVTFTSGQTVDVIKDEEVVATLTYGEAGGKDFQPTKAYSIEGYTGYTAYTEGNKVNPEDQGGTFYTIVPKYDGVIDIAVIINKDKTLIVEEDGVSMGGFEKQTEKLYGIQTFNVKAGKSYKCYVSGSKLGFFGFDYKFPEVEFKVAGTMTGGWSTPINVRANSYTFENLAAGTYQFKVLDGEVWKGYSDLTGVADYLYFDGSGNVCFRLAEAGDVTVNYKSGELFTVAGNFAAPSVSLAGSMNEWSATANVLTDNGATASATINLAAGNYEFKMVVEGTWLTRQGDGGTSYELHRGWRTVDGVNKIVDKGNMTLQADVAGDYTFTWKYATNTLTVTFPTGDLTLNEVDDNTDALTEWDGTSANVTLTRTLKTGMWNTFAAPFSIEIPTGWTVKELTATSYDAIEDKVTMTFGDAEGIVAGKPYLVKVNTNDDLQLNVFSAVTVDKTVRAVTSLDYIDFIPTLGKTLVTGPEGDESNKDAVLFLAADNKLVNPTVVNDPEDAASYIKGFRAYFLLKGDAANARVFNLDLGEGETTSVSEKLKVDSEQFAPAAVMYDLQGRRVQNAAQKGVYIMNGRKVVKK